MPVKKNNPRPQPKPTGSRPKKRRKKILPKTHWTRALLGLCALILVVVLAGYLFQRVAPEKPEPSEAPEKISKKPTTPPIKFEIYPEEPETKLQKPAAPPPVATAPDELPLVCIIIDDMGYDRKLAEKFLSLKTPLTFSMLPFSPFQEAITRASVNRAEIMLHLPMEPDEYPRVDPGPGALLTTMPPDELIRQLILNIRSVPGIKGVNNHMGSKMTAISSQMYQVFSILKKEGLYFIDSRTSANTLCKPSARLLQVPFAERDIFLDHVTTAEFVRKQLGELIRRAQQNGRAIGIGHPHLITYQVLKEMLPEMEKKVRLVPASQLVDTLG